MTRGLQPRPLLLLVCPKPRLLKLCTSISLTHKTEMFHSGMKQKHPSGSMRFNEIGDFIIPSSTPHRHQRETHPLWQDFVSHLPPFNPARSTKKSQRNDPAAITERCRSCCLPVLGDTAWWIFWPHPGHAWLWAVLWCHGDGSVPARSQDPTAANSVIQGETSPSATGQAFQNCRKGMKKGCKSI